MAQSCVSCTPVITTCDSCVYPVRIDSMRAGRADFFSQSDGLEPTNPGPAVSGICSSRPFDDVSCDKCFAHTFYFNSSRSCRTVGAQLRIKMKACPNTAGNDALGFFKRGQAAAVWSSSIANLAGGHWDHGDSATLVLDLCNLPPS